jgi:molybdenum cofactor cytidylyltransferase
MNVEGVVLAAGYSSRAGAFKPELDLGGKTVIERCVDGLAGVCSRIVVVGGYQIEKIRAILKDYPQVEVVYNRDYAAGMFSSVKAGALQVRGERFFITPGDYPLINPAVCQKLLAVDHAIVIPAFGGRKGHPVLMAGSLAQELRRAADADNLRDFIRRKGFQILEVEDEGILMDLDTPEDYQRILERFRERR